MEKQWIQAEFEMNRCPNCSTIVSRGNYCGECAYPLPRLRATAPSEICPECSKVIMMTPTTVYCSNCGVTLNLEVLKKHVDQILEIFEQEMEATNKD